MFRFITFAFILTHSIVAQAGNSLGSVRIDTQKWETVYSGETELDGLPVLVSMEMSRHDLQIQDALIGHKSLVPLIAKERIAYRLVFKASHSPRIQAVYSIEPQTISTEGSPRFAYVSRMDPERDFQFIVTNLDNGSMAAAYSRRLPSGESDHGVIVLNPAVTAL